MASPTSMQSASNLKLSSGWPPGRTWALRTTLAHASGVVHHLPRLAGLLLGAHGARHWPGAGAHGGLTHFVVPKMRELLDMKMPCLQAWLPQ